LKLVVFGLTVSSSFGNGHATLWRGLIRALHRQGHRVLFFEKDLPWYAAHRDLHFLRDGELVLYGDWPGIVWRAERELADADVAIVTSYQPDAIAASEIVLASPARRRLFYDMDTPVTLARVARGEHVDYVHPRGLGEFDLVLSFTGGRALELLRTQLGARRAAPLYGHVDPATHRPALPEMRFLGDFSYLGTYAPDRQEGVERLFFAAARQRPAARFVLGGSLYPRGLEWPRNVFHMPHVAPPDHPAFYASSPLTLNVTRAPMAALGWCPSGRLFEAAACGVPVISDWWEGLDTFFLPEHEILVASSAQDVLDALARPAADLARIGHAARERVLAEHTAERRASELVALVERLPELVAPAVPRAGSRAIAPGPAPRVPS